MQVIEIINKAIAKRDTRFTIELLPPLKGEGVDSVFAAIDPLVEFNPAYVNITCHREEAKYVEHASGLLERRIVRRRPGTVGISAAITKRYSIESVPHLICAGLSRYDIEDSLIDLDFLGIENVLALRGDNMRGENTFLPHADGHVCAANLVSQIASMNRGEFIDGQARNYSNSKFCIGVAGYPEKHSEAPNMQSDLRNLKAKVDAGADYIVTQMSFDNDKIFSFIEACRAEGINIPIIPGIKLLSTKEQLTLLPQIFHVDLPDELVKQAQSCRDNRQIRELGIQWAIAQGRELKAAGLPVIHFYTMGKTDNMAAVAKEIFDRDHSLKIFIHSPFPAITT